MKKTVIFILTALMFFSVQGTNANANANAYEVGNIIEFGSQNWLVLDVQDGHALIISETVKIIGPGHYNYILLDITWVNCSMRFYLNNEYLNNFNAEERLRIRETSIVNNNNPWFGTTGGGATMDRVFMLSAEEVVRYFGDSGQLKNRPAGMMWISDMYDSARVGRDDAGNKAFWWLRSPGALTNLASAIDANGVLWLYGTGVSNRPLGARPALWLKL